MYYLPKIIQRLKLSSMRNCKLDKKSKVIGGCTLLNVSLGKYSYIGRNTIISNTEIGSYCSIATRCMIGGAEHPINFVSTSPVFCTGKNCLNVNFGYNEFQPYSKTVIENDVWIGAGCFIKAGIHISTGSIIGMGSVLTKSTKPYEIWAGNPAKKIRDRFDEGTISKLLALKWWEWDEAEIKEKANLFGNVDLFIQNSNLDLHEQQK